MNHLAPLRNLGERSSLATGTDLVFLPLEDIGIDADGDFATITGSGLIQEALLRALYTPEYGYRRWVRTPEGIKEIDTQYGNKAYRYLSMPADPAAAEAIRDAIYQAAAQDSRLVVKSVIAQPTQAGFAVALVYHLKDDNELRNLSLVIQPPK